MKANRSLAVCIYLRQFYCKAKNNRDNPCEHQPLDGKTNGGIHAIEHSSVIETSEALITWKGLEMILLNEDAREKSSTWFILVI